MSAVCIIPARGGSRRIPRKNIRMFHGKPIIAYSIETAQESGLFTDVWVSTEDEEIGRIAEGYGARWYRRSQKLAKNNIGTQEVTRDFILWMHANDEPYQYVCCIYPTAPMMTADDLRIGFNLLKDSRTNVDFTFSLGIDPLRDAGQWYWGKSQSFINRVPLDWNGWNILKVVIPNDRVCDINTEEDWKKAEQMYAALKEKP